MRVQGCVCDSGFGEHNALAVCVQITVLDVHCAPWYKQCSVVCSTVQCGVCVHQFTAVLLSANGCGSCEAL